MVCLSVRGDDPRALASGFSPVQGDKAWYNYFLAHYEIFRAKVCYFWHGLYEFVNNIV